MCTGSGDVSEVKFSNKKQIISGLRKMLNDFKRCR